MGGVAEGDALEDVAAVPLTLFAWHFSKAPFWCRQQADRPLLIVATTAFRAIGRESGTGHA